MASMAKQKVIEVERNEQMFGIIISLFAHLLEAKAIKGFSIVKIVLCAHFNKRRTSSDRERIYRIGVYTETWHTHEITCRNRRAIRKHKVFHHFAKHYDWKLMLDTTDNELDLNIVHAPPVGASRSDSFTKLSSLLSFEMAALDHPSSPIIASASLRRGST